MILHSGGEFPSGLQRMRVVYHSGTDHQLALKKEGTIQSWKLITVARFIILLLCVCGQVLMCTYVVVMCPC